MKKLFIVIIVIVSMFTLTSCLKEAKVPASGKTKITFMNAFAMQSNNLMGHIIDSFEERYPMFEVEEVSKPHLDSLEEEILSKELSELPTIVQVTPKNVINYLEKDLVLSLDKYLNNKMITSEYLEYLDDANWSCEDIIGYTNQDIEDFVDGFYQEGSLYGDSKMYSIPFLKTTEVLYYNKTFFTEHYQELKSFGVDEEGNWNNLSWDDVMGVSEYYKNFTQELSSKKIGFMSDDLTTLFINLTHQYGSEFIGYENNKRAYLFNNDLSKEAMNNLKDNYQDHLFDILLDNTYASDFFKNQQCLMVTDTTSAASYYANNKFEVGVTSYPQKDETNKSVTISGSNLCLINKNNELETLGGWLFLKWITNYDNSLYLSTHTNYLPIRKSVFEATAFQELISKNELMYEVKEIGFKQNNIFKTVIPFKSYVNTVIEELVVNIMNGEMMDEVYASAIEKCQK